MDENIIEYLMNSTIHEAFQTKIPAKIPSPV